jgi:hypothetical protein
MSAMSTDDQLPVGFGCCRFGSLRVRGAALPVFAARAVTEPEPKRRTAEQVVRPLTWDLERRASERIAERQRAVKRLEGCERVEMVLVFRRMFRFIGGSVAVQAAMVD